VGKRRKFLSHKTFGTYHEKKISSFGEKLLIEMLMAARLYEVFPFLTQSQGIGMWASSSMPETIMQGLKV